MNDQKVITLLKSFLGEPEKANMDKSRKDIQPERLLINRILEKVMYTNTTGLL